MQLLLGSLSSGIEIVAACLEVVPSIIQVILPVALARMLLTLVQLNSPLLSLACLLGAEVRVACGQMALIE